MTTPSSSGFKRCAMCQKWRLETVRELTYITDVDLDTRPIGMLGAHLSLFDRIEQCSRCGYCAPDISKKISVGARVIESSTYQNQLRDKTYPKLARKFLCWRMLLQEKNDLAIMWQAYLCAAWVCDDAKATTAANQCREKVIAILLNPNLTDQQLFPGAGKMVQVEGWTDEAILDSLHAGKLNLWDENMASLDFTTWDDQTIIKAIRSKRAYTRETYLAESIGTREVVLADLLRRIGQFGRVKEICQRGLVKNPSDHVTKLLNFEQKLAEQSDRRRYTVKEVVQPHRKILGRVGCGIALLFVAGGILVLANIKTFFPNLDARFVNLSSGLLISLAIITVVLSLSTLLFKLLYKN